jgi:uroporphyrin-III C-methyltransferase/precorrin-2 dehydrogenase/sirohydrochlorin ferrochelatase
MGLARLGELADGLVAHGRDPATPVAVIADGTNARQRTVVADLASIASAVRERGIEPPAVVVVGDVVALRSSVTGDSS